MDEQITEHRQSVHLFQHKALSPEVKAHTPDDWMWTSMMLDNIEKQLSNGFRISSDKSSG